MTIIKGDSLEELKKLEDNSIDAIVTDPPYGLSFMGKKWDYDVPSTELWSECLRVLKPGGYLLSFAGTRTQHRMAVRIEDAGFEIRDMIAWVYGSGFPKSLNIGKAVDKLQGNEREIVGVSPNDRPNSQVKGGRAFDSAFNEGQEHETINITKGTSEWEGWGTALKPALEPITVARKPISEKTIAENCLKWGVGGINIDGCRVGTPEYTDTEWKKLYGSTRKDSNVNIGNEIKNLDTNLLPKAPSGRFPANLIHDGSKEVLELFPDSNGQGKHKKAHYEANQPINVGGGQVNTSYTDTGSAARFFYCAKSSKSERNMGLDGFEEKEIDNQQNSKLKMQPNGELVEAKHFKRANNHPTVKPIKLMEYLVKLVSKEGHTVLDPFMGSGTTGIACKKLNRNFIGIEQQSEYCDIANARIAAAQPYDKTM